MTGLICTAKPLLIKSTASCKRGRLQEQGYFNVGCWRLNGTLPAWKVLTSLQCLLTEAFLNLVSTLCVETNFAWSLISWQCSAL